jgi:hypothetical protein
MIDDRALRTVAVVWVFSSVFAAAGISCSDPLREPETLLTQLPNQVTANEPTGPITGTTEKGSFSGSSTSSKKARAAAVLCIDW